MAEEQNARDSLTMIDVGEKPLVNRLAIASGEIFLKTTTIDLIREGTLEKGNVIVASKIAGIAAAKRTPDFLPLCHPLALNKVSIDIDVQDDRILVTSEVRAHERTGVEMEALVAVNAALLNIWDMTKMYEKDENGQYPATTISNIHVVRKVKGEPEG
jgi:cyclic pyranopterin phosphate synthase